MEAGADTVQGREVLERFMGAMQTGDVEAIRALVDPDIVMEWPQSGERFRGFENAAAALAATEVAPEIAGEPRIVGAGDVWVVMMPLRYGDEVNQYIGLFELEGGRIQHTTEFFGAPVPAQPGRAAFAEP